MKPARIDIAASPSMMPVTAVALAGGIDVAAAAKRLRWPEMRRYAYGSVYEIDGARLYLFHFGAVVLEGVGSIDPALLEVIADAVGQKVLPETADTYSVRFDVEHPEQSARVGWDQVVIPEAAPGLLGAVALLLAQSAALERYEKGAETLIKEALVLSRKLESVTGARARSEDLRRVGRITSYRLELAGMFYLLDRPEETWEDARVAALYDALFRNLELRERHDTVVLKLQAVEQATEIVLNAWQNRVSNRLEWAIVLLICLEIVLALFKAV